MPLVTEMVALLPPDKPSENEPVYPSAVLWLDCAEPITFCAVASWLI